jgi:hypothetical protein
VKESVRRAEKAAPEVAEAWEKGEVTTEQMDEMVKKPASEQLALLPQVVAQNAEPQIVEGGTGKILGLLGKARSQAAGRAVPRAPTCATPSPGRDPGRTPGPMLESKSSRCASLRQLGRELAGELLERGSGRAVARVAHARG